MPSTAFRSFKKSGMNIGAEAASEANGGIAAQGVGEDFDSTYPTNTPTEATKESPLNSEYKMRLPTTQEPLHTVDLGQVNLKQK